MVHRTAQSATGHGATRVGGRRPGARLGSLIGGAFGLVYVEVNSGSLPVPAPMAIRAAGAAAFAGLLLLLARGRGQTPADTGHPHEWPSLGRGYWLVVAGEGAAVVGGAALLSGPLGLPRAVVAWVSVVVGVHFLPLGAMWDEPLFQVLGAAVAACGVAGLTAAALGAAPPVVAASGGVLPGALLLGSAYWGALRIAAPLPEAAGAVPGGPPAP